MQTTAAERSAKVHVTAMHMTYHVHRYAWTLHNLIKKNAADKWTSSHMPGVCIPAHIDTVWSLLDATQVVSTI